jgi:hypothetical protein
MWKGVERCGKEERDDEVKTIRSVARQSSSLRGWTGAI